jgi:Cd2+/Zn2+-exporting ATPase
MSHSHDSHHCRHQAVERPGVRGAGAGGAPLRLKIAGMDCGSCALTIEDGLRHLPGVRRVAVDFPTEMLEVEGDVDRGALEQRLRQLGYRAAGEPGSPSEAPDGGSQRDGRHPTAAFGTKAWLAFLWSQRRTRIATVAAAALGVVPLAQALGAALPARSFDLVCAAVVAVAGWPIFSKGLRALVFSRRATIELLMALAAIGALAIGQPGEAATVVLLFTLGEALEAFSAARARDSLRSLLALQPQSATRLRAHATGSACSEHGPQGEHEHAHEHAETVAASALVPGDRILVKPGERIAADGVVARGISAIDPSAVTGESLPLDRGPGDEVMAGTINLTGALEIEVLRPAAQSTLARIAQLVAQAQSERSPAERFIDRFARLYTPAIVLLAVLVVAVPVLSFDQPFLESPDGSHGWLYRGLALLIVACPCALVISIPVTVVSALTRLAQLGVLVKGGDRLDRLADVRVVAFDKTGTLTQGRPAVAAVQGRDCTHDPEAQDEEPVPSCASCDEVLALAASVESGSAHPIAHAVTQSAHARGLRHRYPRAETVTAVAGRGVFGHVNGDRIAVGNDTLMTENGVARHGVAATLREAARTVMLVARGGELVGAIGVEDRVRADSRPSLDELRAARPPIRTVMLTGDNERVAARVAAQIGALDEVRANLLPADKLVAVESLRRAHGAVAMVGDGINDAPALASADVGIAMGGSGTAQAMDTADVVLMRDDLLRVPALLRIARRSRALVRQNVALSLGLKLAFVALAVPGWATLWLAVAADVGATLLVTLNGMRMLRAA